MLTRFRLGSPPDAYINAIRMHEGHGTTGHNGHYSAAYDAAADPNNDPMRYFEEVVGPRSISLSTFENEVRRRFQERAQTVEKRAMHIWSGGNVGGNWTGTIWVWLPDQGKFVQSTKSI